MKRDMNLDNQWMDQHKLREILELLDPSAELNL